MKKLIHFFTDDEFLFGTLGEIVFPIVMWFCLMFGTPLILKSMGIGYNILTFLLSLIFWSMGLILTTNTGYYRSGTQIRDFLTKEFSIIEEYNGNVVAAKIYGGCYLWWITKRSRILGAK